MEQMKQDSNLPSEIIVDVVSRLPIRDILSCKCVCKSWLDLLETREFVKLHLSKSKLAIAVFAKKLPIYMKMIEFKDRHDLHHTTITNLHFPHALPFILASADGLLLLNSTSYEHNILYLCNPITREYIDLPVHLLSPRFQVTYGFGACKITGEYKVVRISHNDIYLEHTLLRPSESNCHVYTVGTRSWRSIAFDNQLKYGWGRSATLVNGNLHWFVCDLKGTPRISCFDLETEIFTTFSAPPLECSKLYRIHINALEDHLCLCDNSSESEMVIWLMCEYGVEKSWTRKFCIGGLHPGLGDYLPIKIYEDGDMFIAFSSSGHGRGHFCCYYSGKNRTSHGIEIPGDRQCLVSSHLYIPSFLSLKSFESFVIENVVSY